MTVPPVPHRALTRSNTCSALLPTLKALANASFLGICSIGLMTGSVSYRGISSYIEGDGFARNGLDGGPVPTLFKPCGRSSVFDGSLYRCAMCFVQVLLSTSLLALLRTTGIVIFAFSNQAQVGSSLSSAQSIQLSILSI